MSIDDVRPAFALFVRLLKSKGGISDDTRTMITTAYLLSDGDDRLTLDNLLSLSATEKPFDEDMIEKLAELALPEEFGGLFWNLIGMRLSSEVFHRILTKTLACQLSLDAVHQLVGVAVDHIRAHPGAFRIPGAPIARLLSSDDPEHRIVAQKAWAHSELPIEGIIPALVRGLRSKDFYEIAGSLYTLNDMVETLPEPLKRDDSAFVEIFNSLSDLSQQDEHVDLALHAEQCLMRLSGGESAGSKA